MPGLHAGPLDYGTFIDTILVCFPRLRPATRRVLPPLLPTVDRQSSKALLLSIASPITIGSLSPRTIAENQMLASHPVPNDLGRSDVLCHRLRQSAVGAVMAHGCSR